MKNVIIAGSTGMIGSLIQDLCLRSNQVASVTSIVRKPSGIHHEKLTEVIHPNFLDFSSIIDVFKNQDIAYYCIGVYTGQVPTEEFKKITVDYTRSFATSLKQESPECAFCFLSGEGADQSESSKLLFAKQKGIAENLLLKMGFPKIHIFRPGYIYPDIPRKEPNFAYVLMRWLYKPVSVILPKMGIRSKQLAQKMFDTGLNSENRVVYENRDML